ncbi:MAG: DMT family transporter [Alphaproteobacteria bacterium]|nr:DMT family transporter [Alphaproteobacteria bacterium]
MLYAFGQSLCFAVVSLCVKLAGTEHATIESLFYRNFLGLLIIAAILIMQGNLHKVKGANVKLQFTRAFVGSAAMYVTFMSFELLPLSEAQSLLFAAPLFVVALSYPVLKEKVGPWRTGAALAGFLGILLIVQPGAISSSLGAICGITAALGHAAVILILRHIGKSEEALVTVFYFSGFGTLMVLPFLPFFWHTPSLYMAGIYALLGVSAVILQIFLTKAYKLAPASALAPITYLNLLWSLALDFFLWDYIPGIWVFAGAAVVISSNFVIVYRETIKNQKQIPAPKV